MSKSRRRRQPVAEQTVEPPRSVIPGFWIGAAVILLCCSIFACLVIRHARLTSATYDETAHLPAGYSYLRWNDYRMNPEPARASGPADINSQRPVGHYFLDGPKDETVERFHALNPAVKDPLRIPTTSRRDAADFVNDADSLLLWGRMPIMLLGVMLAVLVFLWARELWGPAGGVVHVWRDVRSVADMWAAGRDQRGVDAALLRAGVCDEGFGDLAAADVGPGGGGRMCWATEWPVGMTGQRTLSAPWPRRWPL